MVALHFKMLFAGMLVIEVFLLEGLSCFAFGEALKVFSRDT